MSPEQQKRLNQLQASAQKILTADHFAALGVSRTASPDAVSAAFVEGAKTWHPDRVPPGMESSRPLFSRVFTRLDVARATLTDPTRRLRYTEELSKPVVAATADDISSAEAELEFRKAEALLKKQDTGAAENHLRRAVHLAPSKVDYRVLLVSLQAKDAAPERLGELVVELDRLIAAAPTSERAYFARGQLRKRLDLLKEAHADFVRVAEINRNNVDAVREIRIYNMRLEKASTGAPKAPEPDGSVSGFFKNLFKR